MDYSVAIPDANPSSEYAARSARVFTEEAGGAAAKATSTAAAGKSKLISFLGTAAVDAVKGKLESDEEKDIKSDLTKLEGPGNPAQQNLRNFTDDLASFSDNPPQDPTLVDQFIDHAKGYIEAQQQGVMSQSEVLTRVAATVKQYSAQAPGWASDFRKAAANLTGIDAVDTYQIHKALTTESDKAKQDAKIQEAQLQLDKNIAENMGVAINQVTPSIRSMWTQHQQLKLAADNADNQTKWQTLGQKGADQAHNQIVSMQLGSEVADIGANFAKLTALNSNPDKVVDAKAFGLQMAGQLQMAQDRMVKFINSRTIPQDGKLAMSEDEAAKRIKGVTDMFNTYQQGLQHIEGRNMFAALVQKSKDDVSALTDNFKLANPYMTMLNSYGVDSKLFEAWVGLGSKEEFEKRFGKNLSDAMQGVMNYPQLHAGTMSRIAAGQNVDMSQLGNLDPNLKAVVATDMFHSPMEWSKDPAPTDAKKSAYSNTMGAATQSFNPAAPQDLKAVYNVLADPNTKSFVPKLTQQQRANAFGPVVAKVEATVPQVGAALQASIAEFNSPANNASRQGQKIELTQNRLTGAFEVVQSEADHPAGVRMAETGSGAVVGARVGRAPIAASADAAAALKRAQGLANQLNTMLETYTLAARTVAPDLNTKLTDVQQRAADGIKTGKFVPLEPGVAKLFGGGQAVPRNTEEPGPGLDQAQVMQAIEAAEKSGDSDVSHKGAAGRYQIMPATAKELGLTVDSTNGVDERLDPAKAGPAAAGYLQKLHSQFGGDIEKAAAAYNAGPGNVRQAEQKAADLGIPDHWKAFLPKPKETVPYIERFKNAMNGVRG
jgi:hypothetical protein